MDNQKITYLLIGLLTGGLAVWLLMANSIISPDWRGNNSSSEIAMGRGGMMSQNIDTHFIEQMIPHHDSAIEMARLAQTKAARPEIKQMAEDIIKSQSAENTQMREWYKEWFGRELPEGDEVMMHHGMMSGHEDLSSLENAANFDVEFISQMIPHHESAVMMASMLKAGTNRTEMKKLADDIITAQTKEIDQMKNWQKEWSN